MRHLLDSQERESEEREGRIRWDGGCRWRD